MFISPGLTLGPIPLGAGRSGQRSDASVTIGLVNICFITIIYTIDIVQEGSWFLHPFAKACICGPHLRRPRSSHSDVNWRQPFGGSRHNSRRELVDAGDDPPSHGLLVLFPVLPILARTLLVIASITVDEENTKVQDVKVGDDHTPALGITLDHLATIVHHDEILRPGISRQDLVACEAGGQAVRPRLDPITHVVDVTSNTPPARREELASLLRLDVLEVRDSGVVGVGSESVLLVIRRAEDVESETNEGKHHT